MNARAFAVAVAGLAMGAASCVDEPSLDHPDIDTSEQEALHSSDHPEYPDINAPPAPVSDPGPVPEEHRLVSVASGAIISPISAIINDGGPGYGSISDTFNQRGLASGFTSGETKFDTYLATHPLHTSIFAGFEWFGNYKTTGATITYDLGAVFTIDRLALWNEESSGIGTLDLFSSTDGTIFTPLVSGLHPIDNPLADYPAEVFAFGPASARFVRLVASDSPQPNPGSFPAAAIGEVAFRVACGNLYSDGHDETNDPDHDLDQAHHEGERSPDVRFYDNVGGEFGALIDFYVGFFGGTSLESTSDDNTLYDHFVSGDGSRLDFAASSDMARIIGGSPAFATFAKGFERAANSYFLRMGTLCGFDGDSYIQTHRPKYFRWPLFAWAVMGGYSRIEAEVIHTDRGNTFRYRIYDHFGAGVHDAWSPLLGLSAMYYLQHFHGVWGTSYTPFIWSVEIQRPLP